MITLEDLSALRCIVVFWLRGSDAILAKIFGIMLYLYILTKSAGIMYLYHPCEKACCTYSVLVEYCTKYFPQKVQHSRYAFQPFVCLFVFSS